MKIITTVLALSLALNLFAQKIDGNWKGKIKTQGIELTIVFHFEETENGLKATMDSPDQKTFGIPVNSISYVDSELKLEIINLNITYTGKSENEDNIIGNFVQGGQSLPLNLLKDTTYETVKVRKKLRPQEPSKPYPYFSEEVIFKNEVDNIILSGTLTLPQKSENFPAVILVSGSGPQNRDEEIFEHKPFLILSDYLTKKGIAVLRYDDRGIAESTGEYSSATTFDFANDAEAAINYLKTRNEIDQSHIGIIGHSEGGVIAPIIASKNNEIDFIILLAGSGLRGDKLLLLQKESIERQMGISEMAIEYNQKLFSGAYELILDTNIESSVLKDTLTEYFTSNYEKVLQTNQIKILTNQLTASWLVNFFRLDPKSYLEKVKCSVLALNGDKDLQVPSKENLKAIQTAFEKGGNKNITIKELAGLNHLFQECETGSLNEYKEIEQTISPLALDEISKWILNIINE